MSDTWQKKFITVASTIIFLLVTTLATLIYGMVNDDKALQHEQGVRLNAVEKTQIGYDKELEFIKLTLVRIEKVVTEIKDKQ